MGLLYGDLPNMIQNTESFHKNQAETEIVDSFKLKSIQLKAFPCKMFKKGHIRKISLLS